MRMYSEGGNPLSFQKRKGYRQCSLKVLRAWRKNVSKTEKYYLKMQKKMAILGRNWILFHGQPSCNPNEQYHSSTYCIKRQRGKILHQKEPSFPHPEIFFFFLIFWFFIQAKSLKLLFFASNHPFSPLPTNFMFERFMGIISKADISKKT